MERKAQFRRRLVVTTAVMLIGISLMAVPHVLDVVVLSWWQSMSTLVILCGAIAELVTVWSISRRAD